MLRLVWILIVGALAFYMLLYAPSHLLKAAPDLVLSPIVQHATATHQQAVNQATVAVIEANQLMAPQWETIHPKPKAECLQVSGGALNPAFVRCHYGIQELVTYDSKGNRKVIQERSIPAPGIPR